MTDNKAIDILSTEISKRSKAKNNIKILLKKKDIETFQILLQDIVDIINTNENNLNELNSVRLSLIEKIKEESDLEKGFLNLNPVCYEWMKNEVENRDLSLIKYFK